MFGANRKKTGLGTGLLNDMVTRKNKMDIAKKQSSLSKSQNQAMKKNLNMQKEEFKNKTYSDFKRGLPKSQSEIQRKRMMQNRANSNK